MRKSRYWRETLQVPHPLLWRNEVSLLVQWRTMYFPLALWTLVCVHRVLSAHRPVYLCAQNTSIRRHTDVVDSSSGRSYVTKQWHNVPFLRTRVLYNIPRVRRSRYSGETLQSPIHCCDVTKPSYLFSGKLCTSPLHCELLFVFIVCCRRTSQCFSMLEFPLSGH